MRFVSISSVDFLDARQDFVLRKLDRQVQRLAERHPKAKRGGVNHYPRKCSARPTNSRFTRAGLLVFG